MESGGERLALRELWRLAWVLAVIMRREDTTPQNDIPRPETQISTPWEAAF